MGVIATVKNLLEGFGYILGGSMAHRMGPRAALTMSAVPMVAGFTLMLSVQEPWAIAVGALFMTNWEPLSVPATFDIVGSEVPKNGAPSPLQSRASRSACRRSSAPRSGDWRSA